MNYRKELERKRDELAEKDYKVINAFLTELNIKEKDAHLWHKYMGFNKGFNALLDQTVKLSEALELEEKHLGSLKTTQETLADFKEFLGSE